MRVNPYPLSDLLSSLNQTQLEAQEAAHQISTGKSVNVPSDDPAAAALLVGNNDEATFNAGYLHDVTAISSQLSAADSTLSSVQSALQQAISLGVEGGNGTLSDADRAAIVAQLQDIQTQVVSLANTSYQGNYLFSGTETGTAPYTLGGLDPSGVTYNGNDGVNQVAIGSAYRLAINQPGSQLFSSSSNSVFLALNNLIAAVQLNSGVDTALPALSSAASYLSVQTVFYGNALDQTQSQTTYLDAAKLQIAQQQNSLGGVDLAAAANNLSQSQTDTQAALAAIAKFAQNNLFNYIQ